MTKRHFLAGALSLALPAAVAGCGGSASTSGGSPSGASTSGGSGGAETTTLTVGYLPNIVIPQPLVGLQNGAFAKALPGVSIDSKTYGAGPAVIEALRGGTVDIAYTGPYPPLNGYVKNGDIVLLAGCATGGTELSVAQNSSIKTLQDLKGQKVAVNQLNSTVDALVRHALLQAKITPNRDVKIVEIEPAEQAEALARGEVAAVAAPAPWPSVARQAGARPLLDWKQILDNGNYLQGVAFTTKKFVEANPDTVRKFVQAHRQITDELNKDRSKADAQVLAAWQKVSKKTLKPAVAKAAFATIRFTNESTLEDWNRVQQIAQEVGILRKSGDLSRFLYQPK